VRKHLFGAPCSTKNEYLPRQAQVKQRETHKRGPLFPGKVFEVGTFLPPAGESIKQPPTPEQITSAVQACIDAAAQAGVETSFWHRFML
jgi:hypothetical protein